MAVVAVFENFIFLIVVGTLVVGGTYAISHKRSCAIRDRVHGPESDKVATSLNNMAAVYKSQGRFDEAHQRDELARALRERTFAHRYADSTFTYRCRYRGVYYINASGNKTYV